MQIRTIEQTDRLEALTGLHIRNLFAASQPVIEQLIIDAGIGIEDSGEPEEIEAFREVEQIALQVWNYRFNFSGSHTFNG